MTLKNIIKRTTLINYFIFFVTIINQKIFSVPIYFQGNKYLSSPQQIIKNINNFPYNDSIYSLWLNQLRIEYFKLGFFWVDLKIDTSHQNIKIIIKENQRAKIKKINFINNNSISTNELNSLIKKSDFFSENVLQKQINTLINYYTNHGFPFIQIQSQNFTIDDVNKNISYDFNIIENSKVYIKDLYFENTTVSQKRLKQIYQFRPNVLYSENEIKQKLNELSKYNLAPVKYLILNSDTNYLLKIQLTKTKSSYLYGGLTYFPNTKNINGYIYFSNYNFLNKLQQVKLAWEKYLQHTDFSLSYNDPYFHNINYTLALKHSNYDTIYSHTDFAIYTKFPVSLLFYYLLTLNYNRFISTINRINSNTTWWFGQGLEISNIIFNNKIQKGYNLSILPKFASRREENSQSYLALMEIKNQSFIPLNDKNNYFIDFIFKTIYSTNTLNSADSLHIGGIKTLRGFEENQFATDKFIIFKNEIRHYLNNIIFFLFDDFALFNENKHVKIKNGWGVGLYANSKIGMIGLDYGLSNINNPLKGKIHLSFQNQF